MTVEELEALDVAAAKSSGIVSDVRGWRYVAALVAAGVMCGALGFVAGFHEIAVHDGGVLYSCGSPIEPRLQGMPYWMRGPVAGDPEVVMTAQRVAAACEVARGTPLVLTKGLLVTSGVLLLIGVGTALATRRSGFSRGMTPEDFLRTS